MHHRRCNISQAQPAQSLAGISQGADPVKHLCQMCVRVDVFHGGAVPKISSFAPPYSGFVRQYLAFACRFPDLARSDRILQILARLTGWFLNSRIPSTIGTLLSLGELVMRLRQHFAKRHSLGYTLGDGMIKVLSVVPLEKQTTIPAHVGPRLNPLFPPRSARNHSYRNCV